MTKLAEALAILPNDSDMIEHNPDEGPSYFCCGGLVTYNIHRSRGSGRKHEDGCWYVKLRALLNEE
jgi:hypothetical protein